MAQTKNVAEKTATKTAPTSGNVVKLSMPPEGVKLPVIVPEKKEEPKATTKTPKAGQFFDPTGLEK